MASGNNERFIPIRFPGKWGALVGIGLALLCPVNVQAESSKKSQISSPDVRPTMHSFAEEIVALQPYLVSPARFAAPESEKEILKHLQRLEELAGSASHIATMKKADNEPTLQMLQGLLRDGKRHFSEGHKEVSRGLVRSSMHLCISCHTRVPMEDLKPIVVPLAAGQKETGNIRFEEARFQYALRDFSAAMATFDELISGYPKNDLTLPQLIDALDAIATIHARLQREPKAGAKHFAKILRRKNLPVFLQEDVQVWQRYFEQWQKESVFSLKDKSDAEVILKADTILGQSVDEPFFLGDRSNQIRYLRASGLLHQFLFERPGTPFAARAYYLLGICYLTLDHSFYLGFDTLYFKTCVERFPNDPMARKCYKLLEEATLLGYSGSSGTHVPDEVQEDLDALRKRLSK